MTDPLTSPQTSIGRAGPGSLVGGRYTLRAAVGHGGMGTVWRATDTQLNRNVAVKEVATPPGIAPEDRDAMHERLLREARAAALLSHPGVVQVYDVVTDGDRPWIVMELLDARSLSDIVLEDGPLAPRAVAKIGVTLLGALEVAHAAGILHRDVKPANVLVCTDGRCVLTDFGVARMPTDQQLTTPGMVLGSPHFISPERALGAAFGPPSDLFSLGVTLFCAVEGRPPFDKGEPIATMHSVVEDPPLPPQRAGVLTEVLYGLLEKDPDRRWDATRARQTLRDLLAGPLASRTPQFPTDPYAMVPAQRLPWQGDASRQVGGRAMLAPGETPADRTDPYGNLSDPYRQLPDAYAAEPDATNAFAPQPAAPQHAAPQQAAPYPAGPGPYLAPPQQAAPYPAGPGPYLAPPQQAAPYPAGPQPAGPYSAAPQGAPYPDAPYPAAARRGAAHSASGGGVAAALSDTGARVLTAARQAPRPVVLAAAAAVAVLLITTSVWLVARDGGGAGDNPGAQRSPAVASVPPSGQPPFPVQTFTARGLQVNLPANWQEVERTAIRVDFEDPDLGELARIRLLTEPAGSDSRQFIERIAEPNIEENCDPPPYQRIDLSETEIDGHPAALLEYTCGAGDDASHTLWVTTVRDGMAYSFFLRLPEPQFNENRGIFDELVRSFQVVGA